MQNAFVKWNLDLLKAVEEVELQVLKIVEPVAAKNQNAHQKWLLHAFVKWNLDLLKAVEEVLVFVK